jgi:hypothetical protein
MSSLNTLYSCDVIQNGNDASPAGPFLTINAAITYMKNNFSAYLASGAHDLPPVLVPPLISHHRLSLLRSTWA